MIEPDPPSDRSPEELTREIRDMVKKLLELHQAAQNVSPIVGANDPDVWIKLMDTSEKVESFLLHLGTAFPELMPDDPDTEPDPAA